MSGQVAAVSGMLIEVSGITGELAVGDRIAVHGQSTAAEPLGHGSVAAEVVGFRDGMARALAFGPLDGLGPRSAATLPFGPGRVRGAGLAVSDGWLGRVVDPLGQPLDGRGALPAGTLRPVRANPPPGAARARLGPRIGLGVREFLEDDLGAEGLARAVTVIATSDQPPLMRREAAYAAMTIAEHFRDQGLHVLLLMDSVTRFCLALREIGLAAGEPPATRGYPPSVFAELPRLLERAGPGPDRGPDSGRITALFTVLVEGDDHNEPVADAVRGILDGHVILDRRIGEAGRYPAVDVLRSLSRTVPGCLEPAEAALVRRARAALSLHADMADLVRLGAYRAGTDPATDEALRLAPRIESVLRQMKGERSTLPDAFAALHDAMELADAA
jgi:flagellum-specific ATP synthase